MTVSNSRRWQVGRWSLLPLTIGIAGVITSQYVKESVETPLFATSLTLTVLSCAVSAYGFEAEQWPRKILGLASTWFTTNHDTSPLANAGKSDAEYYLLDRT